MINRVLDKLKRRVAENSRSKLLENHTFSIISNTCVGGVITHNVGEQFRSPTVNLIIYENDFITFCLNLEAYSECPLEKPDEEETKDLTAIPYPVGVLRGGEKNLPDIRVYFVHYGTFEEAKEKWISRFKRVNYDDIFIIMDRGMEANEEIIEKFYSLPYKNKVMMTDKLDSSRWKNNFRFSFYTDDKFVPGCLYKHVNKGVRQYMWLDEFDYIEWLNTGNIQHSDLVIYPKED